MAKMTPSCDVVTHRISESYDRKLSLRERLSISIHTMRCVLCERYRRQLESIHNMLQRYSSDGEFIEEDEKLPQASKERLKQQLHDSSHLSS